MSTIIDPINSTHLQANKLSEKCTAAYPILMLPLRLEARFMHLEPELTVNNSASDYTLTEMGNSSDQSSAANSIETIQNTIGFLVDKTAALPKDETVEGMGGLTAWKYAAAQEMIELNSYHWMPRYNARIAKLEQTNEALTQTLSDLSLMEDERSRALSSTQLDELSLLSHQVLRALTEGDEVANTKADRFTEVQAHLLQQLQQYRSLLLQYPRLNSKDLRTLTGTLRTVQTAVANWQNKAAAHIQQFKEQGTSLEEALSNVQNHLDAVYTTLSEEADFRLELPIWKGFVGIRGRLAKYHTALKTDDLPETNRLLTELQTYTQALLEPVGQLEHPALMIHAQVLLLKADWEHLEARSVAHYSTKIAQLNHYQGTTDQLAEAIAPALEALVVNDRSRFNATALIGQLETLLEQLASLPETVSDWTFAQILLHTRLYALSQSLQRIVDLKKTDHRQVHEHWATIQERLSLWGQAVGQWTETYRTQQEHAQNTARELQQELQALNQEHLQNQERAPLAQSWQAQHQWRLFLERLLDAPTEQLNQQLDQLSTLNSHLLQSAASLEELEPTQALHFALADNLGGSEAILDAFKGVRAGVVQAFEGYNRQLLDHQRRIRALKDGVLVHPKAPRSILEAQQPLLGYLYQRVSMLGAKKITGSHIDLLLYDQWQLNGVLEALATTLSRIDQVSEEGMNWLNDFQGQLNEAVQVRRQNIAAWLAFLEEQEEDLNTKVTALRSAVATQAEAYLPTIKQAPLFHLQRQAQRLHHLSAVLESPLVRPLHTLPLLEALQEALDQWVAPKYTAAKITPGHKEALSKILQEAKRQAQKAAALKQAEPQIIRGQEYALAHAYQELESVQAYVLDHRGEAALSEVEANALSTTVQQLAHQLTQSSAISASATHQGLQLEAAQQSLLDLTNRLQQLAQRRLTEDGQLAVKRHLAPLAEAYEQAQSSLREQREELADQAQTYANQANNLRTQGGNGQTVLAAMAPGGSHTGYINDKTIICTFPIIPWGGTGGGGGDPDPDPDPDPTTQSNYELWIRAYPDAIAINAHEQRLTDQEIADGIQYWSHAWQAAGDSQVELGAWRALVSNYGAERAAWIVRKMTPTNLAQRPVALNVAVSVLEELQLMKEGSLLETGRNFWNDVRITQASPKEQRQVVEGFKAQHPEGKAEALSYLTYPEIMGDILREASYPSAAPEGLDPNPRRSGPDLRLSSTLLETRIERMMVNRLAVTLTHPTPQFPTLSPEERRDSTWSMAAYTDVMPDQLVFLLYNWEGEVAYEVMGSLIPEQLQVGIDPNNDQQFDPSQPDLGIPNDTIKWLTNFEEAVAKGMAVKVPIAPEEGARAIGGSTLKPGFSRLYVLGVKHYDREEANTVVPNIEQLGQQQFADLLDAHHYTDGGLAIVPPGTPTNNSSGATSDFSAFSHDVNGSFQIEINTALPNGIDPKRPQDGHRLAQALGISPDIFKHVKNNRARSSHNAEVINKALWMSTWGLYLEELFSHRDGFTNNKTTLATNLPMSANVEFFAYFKFPEDLDKVYQFFVQHVKGRGALPALRVGKQPYGILTTSLLQANQAGWRWDSTPTTGATDGLNRSYLLKFRTLLLEYLWGYKADNDTRNQKWLRVVEEKIRTVDDLPTSSGGSILTDLQEQFMTILRVHPTAASYYARYALNPYSISDSGFSNNDYRDIFRGSGVKLLNAWVQFSSDLAREFEPFLETHTQSIPGHSISTSDTLINDLRLFATYGSDQTDTLQPLDGLVVDVQGPEPEQQPLSNIPNTPLNYIQWLRSTSPDELIGRTKQPDESFAQGGEPSNALLYIALRNALLNQYWDAAMRIFEKENLRDFTFKNFSYNGKTGWKALKEYNDANANVSHTVFNPNENYYASELKRNDTLNTIQKFYNYGFLKRDSYKAFVKATDNVLANNAPEYGDQVVLAGGRLPFLLEVTTADVGISTPVPLTMAAYLFPGTGLLPINALADYPAETAPLKAMLEALDVLAGQSVAELERLFGEHMDLASHRLDAWILGMANKRLQTIRAQNATGTYLGSYGWLMDLQPGGQRLSMSQTPLTYTIDASGNAPVMSDPDNQGYLQAPSLSHAMTGAVLRSGYEAHKGTADENLLAVNLSSERVRRALFYIEGVNNGQHLGALLGYRLERHLRAAQLAQYTLPFREAYPIEQLTYADGGGQPLAPTAPGSVINGLALVERLRALEITPMPFTTAFDFVQAADASEVETALDKMVQDMDALADLALAEGTHQMVMGNYSRSNAMMRALSEGTTIPEPTIIETPRSSHTLTHRVGMTLPVLDPLTATPLWATQLTQRALTEPALNAKLAELLPDPAQVQCRVSYIRDMGNGAITEETTVLSLADLNIEPIDLLYLFPERLGEQHSELAKRFHHAALADAQAIYPAFSVYRFTVDFDYDNVGGDYTVADVAPLLTQLKLLLVNGRYLRAADLIHPTTTTDGLELTGVNASSLQQLAGRVTALRTNLEQVAQALPAQPTASELWSLVAYGLDDVAPAAPKAAAGAAPDYSGLATLAQTLVADRLTQYDQVIAPIANDPALTTDDKITLYQKGASILLGESFLVVPLVVALNTQDLQLAYGDRGLILPTGDAMAVERWTAGAARVRRQINRLENVSFLQGLFLDYPTESLPLSPLQLPYRANDAWVGLEIPTNYYEEHYNDPQPVGLDKLSLVMHWEAPPSAGAIVGLLLDEWTETIPLSEETAGLAFHYDQPNAKPPQSILQAVHPHGSSASIPWKWHQLVGTLDTTLELAKMRAVEPDHLQTQAFSGVNYSTGTLPFDAFSQLLPATFALVAPADSDRSWSTDYHQNIDNHLYKND